MTPANRRPAVRAIVLLVVPLVGCFTGPSVLSREWQAQLASAPMCDVTLETLDVSSWRQVQSRGFRLCVPDSWRLLRPPSMSRDDPYGRGGWRSIDTQFQWMFSPGQSASECGLSAAAFGRARHQWAEQIGDESVCIMLDVTFVRAYWDDGLLIQGNARDANGTARLLGVVRTVRLLGPGGPPPPTQ